MEKSAKEQEKQEKMWAGLSKDRIAVLHARALNDPNKPGSETFLKWHARFHGGLSGGKSRKEVVPSQRATKLLATSKKGVGFGAGKDTKAVGGEYGGSGNVAPKHGAVKVYSPDEIEKLNRERGTVPVKLSPAEAAKKTNLERFKQMMSKKQRTSARKFDVPTARPEADDASDLISAHRSMHNMDEESEQVAEGSRYNPDGTPKMVGFNAAVKFARRENFKTMLHKFRRGLANDDLSDFEASGGSEGGNNKNKKKQGVAESSPFSYGAKKPRQGSVADLAAKKRKEQDKNYKPIEPKDQMVGTAKVTKGVAEEVEQIDEESPAWKAERENWAQVQNMDRGSITGGKHEVKKHLNYLYAVHDHLKRFGKDTKQVKDKIERINRSKIAEESEQVDENYLAFMAGQEIGKAVMAHPQAAGVAAATAAAAYGAKKVSDYIKKRRKDTETINSLPSKTPQWLHHQRKWGVHSNRVASSIENEIKNRRTGMVKNEEVESVDEARRMSAAEKLGRAFDREQQKSADSRRRGQKLMQQIRDKKESEAAVRKAMEKELEHNPHYKTEEIEKVEESRHMRDLDPDMMRAYNQSAEAEKVLGGPVRPISAAVGGKGKPKTLRNFTARLAARAMKARNK